MYILLNTCMYTCLYIGSAAQKRCCMQPRLHSINHLTDAVPVRNQATLERIGHVSDEHAWPRHGSEKFCY